LICLIFMMMFIPPSWTKISALDSFHIGITGPRPDSFHIGKGFEQTPCPVADIIPR
jgi:hypothetical protein